MDRTKLLHSVMLTSFPAFIVFLLTACIHTRPLFQSEMVTFTVNDKVLELNGRDNCLIEQVFFEGSSIEQEPFNIPLHLLANETIIRVDLICIDSDTIMPINEYCIRFFKVILENNRIDSIGSVGAEETLHLKDKDDG